MSFLATAGIFNTKPTGGATTTFSIVQSAFSPTNNQDNPTATFGGSCTVGNLLLAQVSHRNGSPSHTDFTCVDNNSKTWTKITGYDNALADANCRCATSYWWREFEASGETNNPPTITGDDGTTNVSKRCMMVEIQASTGTGYDWTVAGSAVAGTGTTQGLLNTGISSGSTGSISGSDLYVAAFLMGRLGVTATACTFDESGDSAFGDGDDNASIVFGFQQENSGQAGANFSTTGSVDGSGTEGIVAQIVFQNGA